MKTSSNNNKKMCSDFDKNKCFQNGIQLIFKKMRAFICFLFVLDRLE